MGRIRQRIGNQRGLAGYADADLPHLTERPVYMLR